MIETNSIEVLTLCLVSVLLGLVIGMVIEYLR